MYFCPARAAPGAAYRAFMPLLNEPFVAGLVLAAGGSRRLGRPEAAAALRRRRRCSTPRSAPRVPAPFDQLDVAVGGSGRRGSAPTVDLDGAPTRIVVNDAPYGAGCSSSTRRRSRRPRPARRRARAPARRPAGGDGRRRFAALLAGRGEETRLAGLPLRRRPRAPVRVRPRRVRRPRRRCTATRRCGSCSSAARGDVAEVPVVGPVPLDVDTGEDYEAVLFFSLRERRGPPGSRGAGPRARSPRRGAREHAWWRRTTSPTPGS